MGCGGSAPAPPPPPDYKALATQQAEIDEAAFNRQLEANRANQITPYGSLSWEKDPTTGKWTSTEKLNDAAQATLTAQQQAQLALANTGQGLLGRATEAVAQPMDFSKLQDVQRFQAANLPDYANLPSYGNIDPSKLGAYGSMDQSKLSAYGDYDKSALDQLGTGFGSVQEVQQAMMGQLQPGLTQARNAEIQRLKSQGITEGSQAWNQAMDTLNRSQNDASQKALLGGMSAYGDIFSRGLQKNAAEVQAAQYANALRGQQLGEQGVFANYADTQRAQQLGEQGVMADYATRLRQNMLGEGVQRTNLENASGLMQREQDTADRSRQLQDMLTQRQMPLNEFNSFMSGTQIQNPNFSNYSTGQGLQGAQLASAAQSQYQDAIARNNAAGAAGAGKIGGALSGAATGAALGSMVPVIGTGIGAVAGGLLGYFGG